VAYEPDGVGALDPALPLGSRGHRPWPAGWHEIGGEVGERSQNEEPLSRGGVRDLEPLDAVALAARAAARLGSLEPEPVLAEEDQVEVELPRPPAPAVAPSERPLEPLERDEEGQRPFGRGGPGGHLERHDRIVEVALLEHAHGPRPVETGDLPDADTRERRERAHGERERPSCVAQVGAHPDVRALGRHHPAPPGVARRSEILACVSDVITVIFHQPPDEGGPPLSALLTAARAAVAERHARLFRGAGSRVVIDVRASAPEGSFGARLAAAVNEHARGAGGIVVLGSGAVPLLRRQDAVALVRTAASGGRRALTNNRYSSDVCAVSEPGVLARVPALRSDNALPRWLEEEAGFGVDELRARGRLAFDLDSPLDLAVLAISPDTPAALRRLAQREGLTVPRAEELRAAAADPRAELLVAGRAGSATLRWLERDTACRVRFLSEERGLRSGWATEGNPRAPRSVLGRLLDARGPHALAAVVSELADAAVIDTRLLLADRLGADERGWPSPDERFASDLHRVHDVRDPWLRTLTASAAAARLPILLGAHTLVGAALPRILASRAGRPAERGHGPSLG
jgi:hypothetical protein